jgi:hypothetical protein
MYGGIDQLFFAAVRVLRRSGIADQNLKEIRTLQL